MAIAQQNAINASRSNSSNQPQSQQQPPVLLVVPVFTSTSGIH
jgi:hypothetical protein